MKSKLFITINIALLLFGVLPSIAWAEGAAPQREVVVYVGKNKELPDDIKIKRNTSVNGIYVVTEDEIPKLKQKKDHGEIRAFSFNQEYRVALEPNDPQYSNQWALSKLDAPRAWNLVTGGDAVTVAVVDTGFQLNHEDLVGRFITGHDFVSGASDVNDPSLSPYVEDCGIDGPAYFHGTMVAGVIAANANNAKGIAGLDQATKIMPLQAMDNCGSGNTDSIAAAVLYAINNDADIINMSLGYHPDPEIGPDTTLSAVIEDALTAGVVVVAASGNENREVSYPASHPGVLAVGSVNGTDVRSSFSNFGPELDVVAPGENIITTDTTWNGSTYSNNTYVYGDGTSFATPFVSGLASLLVSQGYGSEEVVERITGGAVKVAGMGGASVTSLYGYGRINAFNSIDGFSPSKLLTTPITFNTSTKIVGQRLVANFNLTNNNIKAVNLERLKIDIRGTGDTQDIVGGSGVVVAPGETVALSSYTNGRYLSDNGNYIARISIKVEGVWQQIGSVSYLTIRNPRASDFTFSPVVYLYPSTVRKDGVVRARYGITNRTNSSIRTTRIKLDIRDSQRTQDMGGYSGRTLNSNTRFNFDLSKRMSYPGYYRCTAAINIYGRWVVLSPSVYLRVR